MAFELNRLMPITQSADQRHVFKHKQEVMHLANWKQQQKQLHNRRYNTFSHFRQICLVNITTIHLIPYTQCIVYISRFELKCVLLSFRLTTTPIRTLSHSGHISFYDRIVLKSSSCLKCSTSADGLIGCWEFGPGTRKTCQTHSWKLSTLSHMITAQCIHWTIFYFDRILIYKIKHIVLSVFCR